MNSLLKKIGKDILEGAAIAAQFYPLTAPFVRGLTSAGSAPAPVMNDLSKIAQLVTTVEAAAGAVKNTDGSPMSGEQKIKVVEALMPAVLNGSELLAGKHVKDQDLFNKAAAGYAQATVDLLNSLDE